MNWCETTRKLSHQNQIKQTLKSMRLSDDEKIAVAEFLDSEYK